MRVQIHNIYYISVLPLKLGLSGMANKNIYCSVKFEFHVNNDFFFVISISHSIFGKYLSKYIHQIYGHLKFRFYGVSCILTESPNWDEY